MYVFLCKFLPASIANIIMVAWYVTLTIYVIAYSSVTVAEFRYLNL